MEDRYSKLGQEITDPRSILYVEGLLVRHPHRPKTCCPAHHLLLPSVPAGRHGCSGLGLRLTVSETKQEHRQLLAAM